MFDKNNHYELIQDKFNITRDNLIMYALMNFDKAEDSFNTYYKPLLNKDLNIDGKSYRYEEKVKGVYFYKNEEGITISVERKVYSFYNEIKKNPKKLNHFVNKINKLKAQENFCEISYIVRNIETGKELEIKLGTKIDQYRISLLSKNKLFSDKFRKKVVNKLSSFNTRINEKLKLVEQSKIPIYRVFYYNRNRGDYDLKNGGFRRNGYELVDYVFHHIFH